MGLGEQGMAVRWGRCPRFVLPWKKCLWERMREAPAYSRDAVPFNTGNSQTADSTCKGKDRIGLMHLFPR